MINDTTDSFGFLSWESTGTDIVCLNGIGMETRTRDYHFDNSIRNGNVLLFQYTLYGIGRVSIDGKDYILEKDQAFFLELPSDSSYGLTGDGESWSFIWIMLSGSAVMDYYKLVCYKYGRIFSLFENSYSINVLRQIYALAQSKGIREVTLSQELSFSFICRLSEGISNYSVRYSPLTINAIQIIESEFSSLRGLAEISERMGVSQEHLSRTFSRETGYALIERLTRKRLSHAVSLLKDKRKTIDQIAGECGFSCGNYFSKAFKRMFGVSPKSYRNMEQHSIYSYVIELN